MTSAQITDRIISRFPEAFSIGLSLAYPNAVPVENMEVIYTVNFVGYDGANTNYTIQFEVVSKGEFKYIEDSFKKR